MGRPLRMDGCGSYQHVMFKGLNDLYLFKESAAKQQYLDILFHYTTKHDVKVLAYCIMDNHAHLLLQSGQSKGQDITGKLRICISDFMHDVQTAFSKWYNKRNKRKGPLYDNRFKSFTCRTSHYFLYALTYILSNAYHHGKTKSLNYKYSSYRNLVTGKGPCAIDELGKCLNMPLEAVIDEVHQRVSLESYPAIDNLIAQILKLSDIEQVNAMLSKLNFMLEDLHGRMHIEYFKECQKRLIAALQTIDVPVKDSAKLLSLSKSYIYKKYKT